MPRQAAGGSWRRPYVPGPLRVAVAVAGLLITACLMTAVGVMALASGTGAAARWLVTAALVIAGALRFLRVGVWVREAGLRQVRLFHSVTVPWDQVAAVRTAQQPVRWLGLPRSVQGQALVVTRTDGSGLRPLLTNHSLDFIGRGDAFDIAADAIEARAARMR